MPEIHTPVHDVRQLVKLRKRGIYIYALPNLFTSANFLLGFMAILFSADHRFVNAAWCILLASVFDLLDGRVARLTNTTSRFGVEYDSLCDLVSFGVAPATVLYFAALQPFHRLGMVASLIYGLCGALRLARFNVLSDVLPKSYFQGLPIPMASMVVATGVLFARVNSLELMGNPAVVVIAIALGLLMVSTFRFPSFKDFQLRKRRHFSLIALTFALLVILIAWFEWSAFLLFTAYIVISLLLDLWRASRKWQKKTSTV